MADAGAAGAHSGPDQRPRRHQRAQEETIKLYQYIFN